jgi:hypothetical protein
VKLLGFLGKSVRYCGNGLSPADELLKLLGLLAKSVRFVVNSFGLQLPVSASNFRFRPLTSACGLQLPVYIFFVELFIFLSSLTEFFFFLNSCDLCFFSKSRLSWLARMDLSVEMDCLSAMD